MKQKYNKDSYIFELESRMNNFVQQINKYLNQIEQYNKEMTNYTYYLDGNNIKEVNKVDNLINELELYKAEIERKNDSINDLKKNLRNQIFLNDDYEYAITDLEKELKSLNHKYTKLSKELVDTRIELNNIKIEYENNIQSNNEKIEQLINEKEALILQNNKLSEEKEIMQKNLLYTVNELKEIREELNKYNNINLKKSINDSIIQDFYNI